MDIPVRPSLADLLSVSDWTREVLQHIVDRKVFEGLSIEFKAGGYFDDHLQQSGRLKKDRRLDFVRRVVGLANAEGGVLIIGIGEDSTSRAESLEAVREFNPRDIDGWWAHLMSEVRPVIRPVPTLTVIRDEVGIPAFWVVVVRPVSSALLLSVRNIKGGAVFPARIGEHTPNLDEWAVHAILSGTRRVPSLAVSPGGRAVFEGRDDGWTEFRLTLTIANTSFAWADDLTWGVLAPAEPKTRFDAGSHTRAPSRVDRHFAPEVVAAEGLDHLWLLQPGARSVLPQLAPHASDRIGLALALELPARTRSIDLHMALYLVCRNLLPTWWSVRMTKEIAVPGPEVEVRKLGGSGASALGRVPVGISVF